MLDYERLSENRGGVVEPAYAVASPNTPSRCPDRTSTQSYAGLRCRQFRVIAASCDSHPRYCAGGGCDRDEPLRRIAPVLEQGVGYHLQSQ